jgi:hypothetical protein
MVMVRGMESSALARVPRLAGRRKDAAGRRPAVVWTVSVFKERSPGGASWLASMDRGSDTARRGECSTWNTRGARVSSANGVAAVVALRALVLAAAPCDAPPVVATVRRLSPNSFARVLMAPR